VLIVDNEPDITLLFSTALEERGLKVDSFNDPLLALSNFKADFYDLLIVDFKMPKINGFDLYNEIKKIDDKIKICFFTAYEINYERLTEGLSNSNKSVAQCLIQKPIALDDFVIKINALLN
jgi:two-component system, OmpR family, response regulator ChvI